MSFNNTSWKLMIARLPQEQCIFPRILCFIKTSLFLKGLLLRDLDAPKMSANCFPSAADNNFVLVKLSCTMNPLSGCNFAS